MENIGKYQIIRELGKGATATVYLCRDPDFDREVAVKLIRFGHDSAAMSRRMRKLFQNERMVSSRLNHPNIVQVFEAVVEDDFAYLAMEYIDGYTLEDHISFDRLLPMHRVISIIFKCCMALDNAYRQGIVHRDIKPANIMVTADDEPKIADFGLALNLSKDTHEDSTFIMGVGSPAYMSPEQIKGYQLNQKTDLYSLGVVLFQLLTGRLPFRANNKATLIYRIINNDPPVVSDLNPNLPQALNSVLRKALEKDLYSRYRNGAEFAKDLSAVRYQILGDDDVERDDQHFQQLRRLEFFTEFENIELWELLRVSVWRELPAGVTVIREGDHGRWVGVLVAGCLEISVGGHAVSRVPAGEPIGEMAYLHPSDDERYASATTMEPTILLEINAAALELGSEELLNRVRSVLLGRVIDRARRASKDLAALNVSATQGGKHSYAAKLLQENGFELKLLPL